MLRRSKLERSKAFLYYAPEKRRTFRQEHIVKTDQCRKFSTRKLRTESQVVIVRMLIKLWFYALTSVPYIYYNVTKS